MRALCKTKVYAFCKARADDSAGQWWYDSVPVKGDEIFMKFFNSNSDASKNNAASDNSADQDKTELQTPVQDKPVSQDLAQENAQSQAQAVNDEPNKAANTEQKKSYFSWFKRNKSPQDTAKPAPVSQGQAPLVEEKQPSAEPQSSSEQEQKPLAQGNEPLVQDEEPTVQAEPTPAHKLDVDAVSPQHDSNTTHSTAEPAEPDSAVLANQATRAEPMQSSPLERAVPDSSTASNEDVSAQTETTLETPAPQIHADVNTADVDKTAVSSDSDKPDISSQSREQGHEQQASDANSTEAPKKDGFFTRLKRGLNRTSESFVAGLGNLFLGKKTIDADMLEELESQLLIADVGVEATMAITASLTERVSRKELTQPEALQQALKEELLALLTPCEKPLEVSAHSPYVILMVGVNGVGKTTTIGKLAKRYIGEGRSVMLAAGDTFRAAAVEQLQVWGERNQVPVIAQHTGADSASVIYDALQAAKARNVDVLIADTAGRLHNKDNLMDELRKVVRVMGKLDDNAPHEVMLVLDAGTGQNALAQAAHFQEAVGVSGLTLTKLDGTAKGGVIFAIARKLGLPIRFIGVGEAAEDLRPFAAKDFIDALFGEERKS